eukprot:1044196-Prymnesium_polylepis.2
MCLYPSLQIARLLEPVSTGVRVVIVMGNCGRFGLSVSVDVIWKKAGAVHGAVNPIGSSE